MSDDRVLGYFTSMNDEREGAGKRASETELTQAPALRQGLEGRRLLGQARQLKHSKSVRTKCDNTFP